jgi:hypothetical protein
MLMEMGMVRQCRAKGGIWIDSKLVRRSGSGADHGC